MKSIVYQIDNSLSKLIEMKRRFTKIKRRFIQTFWNTVVLQTFK